MRETTYSYLIGAYLRLIEDLKEARALAPYQDDLNKDQIEDLKLSARELRDLLPIKCRRKHDHLLK